MAHNISPEDCPIEQEIVTEYLPHRDPILLVDRVLSYDEDNITTEVDLSKHADLFKGHFPDRAILPGIYMIEMAAQAGALLVNLSDGVADGYFIGFAGVDNVKFKSPVQPDDVLHVQVEIVRRRGPIYKFKGRVTVDNILAVSLDFTASLMKFSG